MSWTDEELLALERRLLPAMYLFGLLMLGVNIYRQVSGAW